MQVQTVTYAATWGTYYRSGWFVPHPKMDDHMAEMLNDGWRVQSQVMRPAPGAGLLHVKQGPDKLIVTYVKD